MSMITPQRAAGNEGLGERGFAMLFAVLTSSVLLAISLSIFNLTIKELALSSSGRESHAAFYAADSGIECGLYWDISQQIFATSSDSGSFPSGVSCAGQTIEEADVSIAQGFSSATSTFSFAPTDADSSALNGGVCALVSVSKRFDSGTGLIKTEVISRGYNTGYSTGSNCSAYDDLKVERALKVSY
jgi:hypothetical protein